MAYTHTATRNRIGTRYVSIQCVCMYVLVYFPCFSYITHLKIYYTYLLRHYSYRVTLYFIYCVSVLHIRHLFEVFDYFRFIYSAVRVSLTYFGLQRFGYCFPGLLFLGLNPMKCPISPWSRYSMSRCCCCNHQAELGFLFSHGFLAWSG